MERGALPIADGEPLPLQPPRQRRVLRPDAVGDVEKIAVRGEREDPAGGMERRRQLEADERGKAAGERADPRYRLPIAAGVEPVGGEEDGGGPRCENRLTLRQIAALVERLTHAIDDASAGDEVSRDGRADDFPGHSENAPPRVAVEVVDMTGVHVHRRHDPGRHGAVDVRGEPLPVNGAGVVDGEEHGRDSPDRAAP